MKVRLATAEGLAMHSTLHPRTRPGDPDPIALNAAPLTFSTERQTILLAEDNDALRRLAARVLDEWGYCVLEAGDAEQALRLAEEYEGPIHLLMTDMVMPDLSGVELAGRVTASRSETRVLYVSDRTDERIAFHSVLNHQPAFVGKPFCAETLARTVRGVLDD